MTMMEAIKKGVSVKQETITIATAIKKIHDKDYIIPDCRPDLNWSHEQKIGLISSILMSFPFPYFVFIEDEHGKLHLKDGVQRINTIKQFMNNDIRLTEYIPMIGIEWPVLCGKAFKELPRVYQKRIEDFTLQFVIIPFGTPKEVLSYITWSLNDHRYRYYNMGYDAGFNRQEPITITAAVKKGG